MANYPHLLQDTKPRFESPAKVFAMLKSRVQREGICTKEETFTDNVRENHGAVCKSPMKKAESAVKENQRFYPNESQALSLSAISPPQKIGYSDNSSKHVGEMPPPVTGHGCTPTTLSHLSSPVNRQQIYTEPLQVRDSGGFKVTSKTQVNTQPVENDCVFEEGCAPLDKPIPPADMLSPTKKRLKKSNWEPQEFNTVSSSTKEISNEAISQPQERKTSSVFSEDNLTCMDLHLGNVRGFPAQPSEMNQFTQEPLFSSPRTTAKKRCYAAVESFKSPAKIFAYMKERESKAKQQELHSVSCSTKDLFDDDNFHQPEDMSPASTTHNMGETEDIVLSSVVPVNQSRVESADRQSDTHISENVPSLAALPQPVLLEDPILLNSPRISIPKKKEAVFKRNKWPQTTKFPCESVIYLKKWFLRRNIKGLFVDGINRDNNIPWNSNIIVERVSSSVVKTVSGSVYILVGKINMTDSELPKWLLKKFANGFPPDWKALYERFLSESREETARNNERKSVVPKTKSDPSSMNRSVKQLKQKSVKTPESCPPESFCANVSRSGRVIKPPLEYWKGGRVILDAHMNVTIHECYETSICVPVNTSVSTRASQKPTRVFLPRSEGRKQLESASDKEVTEPLRRVKDPVRKCNSAKVKPEDKPTYSPEPPVDTLTSPEEWSGRPTRSSRRRPAAQRTMHVPQTQSEPEKSSTRRSKRQTHNTTKPSVRVLASKRVSASSDDWVIGRKKQLRKEEHGKGGRRVLDKSRRNYMVPSSESSKSSDKIEEELESYQHVKSGADRSRSEQSESDSSEEESAPQKAPRRKRNSDKVKPEDKTSYSPEPPVDTLSRPEGWSERPTRSSRRHPAAQRTMYVDSVPQKPSEAEKSSTQRSKRQIDNTTSPSVRVLGSKQASASSDEGLIGRKKPRKEEHRKGGTRVLNQSRPNVLPSSESSKSSDEIEKKLGKRTRIEQTRHRQSRHTKSSSSSTPTKPLPKLTQSSKNKTKANKGKTPIPQEQDADKWTEAELMKLQEAVSYYPNHMAGYWAKVARMVGTRSAEECHYQHTSKGASKTSTERARKPQKEKVEAPKGPDHPVISAGVGTYKRKQQVRQFLEAMPRDDVEDVFRSEYMQNKRFEMPSMCPSDHDFTASEMEPLSPMSTGFPGAKTPQCLHITPGMMGSPSRNNGDKYVYQLQKRMKKNTFAVCKQAHSKRFTPTPSVKRTMRRCGNTENDTFVAWEMFPGNDGALSESGEEEDLYFSDNE